MSSNFPPEVPKDEPPDPCENRALSDAYRDSRRNLVVICGLSLAWSTAQFAVDDTRIDLAGISIDLKYSSIPLLLVTILSYLTIRWVIEFAMMPRHVRKWPLARLDFRLVSIAARFSLLAITAGALDQSLLTIARVIGALVILALLSVVGTFVLMFITVPIRMFKKKSAAAGAIEGIFWAGFVAIVLNVAATIGFGIASYTNEPLRNLVWAKPPDPVALAFFVSSLVSVFLSHWLLTPVINRLFAIRPPYYTERTPEGGLVQTFVSREQEPLL